jgi:hypothetical protein
MEALLISLTGLLLFAATIGALPFLYAAWRRARERRSDLQIWRVMARRGVVADESPATQAKLARAVRRCVLCPSIEQCDGWLASGAGGGLEDFCPNATVFKSGRV